MSGTNFISALSPEHLAHMQEKNPFIRLSDAVYSILEEAIITYKLEPGTRLVISKIAEALNVSDSPVREAMDALVQSGLVMERLNGRKYKAYSVFDLTDEEMTALYDARKAIENTSAYLCAEDNSSLDMAELKRLVKLFHEEMDSYIEKANPNAMKYDRAFHNLIVEATNNKYLIDMYKTIDKDLQCLSFRSCDYMAHDPRRENLYKMCRQHQAIYNAIEQGFPDMARRLMDEHINFCSVRNIVNRDN